LGAPAGPAAPCSLRKGLLPPAASSHRILLHAAAACRCSLARAARLPMHRRSVLPALPLYCAATPSLVPALLRRRACEKKLASWRFNI